MSMEQILLEMSNASIANRPVKSNKVKQADIELTNELLASLLNTRNTAKEQ